MRILIVSEFFPTGKDLRYTGGVESRTFFVAKKLAKKHKITILTNRLVNSKEKEIIFGINILRVGEKKRTKATASSLFQRIRFVLNCIKVSRGIFIDVVEGTNFITHPTAYIIAKIKHIPAVAWYPDVWIGHWITNTNFVMGVFGEILERINLRLNFNQFIAISNTTKNKLQIHIDKKIAVIPCGIDANEFKNGIKKNKHQLICVSRMAKYKNIKDLILAFALLHKSNSKLKLTIVGTGPEEKNLKDLAKNLKIKRSVKFVSNLSRHDLVKHLSQSAVFCLPTMVEGFGISIIEAAAAKTPYVTTNISVLKEVTKNYLGGMSYDVGDIHSLAKRVNTMISDLSLYRKKQMDCKKLSNYYNWNQIAIKTEKLYRSLI